VVEEIDAPALICRSNTILGTNQAFASLMGSTQTDLIGFKIDDLIGHSGSEMIKTTVRKCFENPENGPVECTVPLNGQEKQNQKSRISVSPLDGMKDVFLMVVRTG
jgi:PAS domain-containing protein